MRKPNKAFVSFTTEIGAAPAVVAVDATVISEPPDHRHISVEVERISLPGGTLVPDHIFEKYEEQITRECIGRAYEMRARLARLR